MFLPRQTGSELEMIPNAGGYSREEYTFVAPIYIIERYL
ncbi:hypothetical protein SAMN05421752_109140 [Natronorubrum thiooxidans]|uniref:Uncharacterized protein n=1 Tax=Natronorubrum thiooxidans TaxID=308853 RepID=A0A1N7G2A9_9EURY|nr:hypothetical protein SAMN05421752_109140 [Natronorubrum thiooxidans]